MYQRRPFPRPVGLRIPIVDAIECMVPTLTRVTGDILLCSTVFGPNVGPGDCHLLGSPGRLLPSDEVLFNVARSTRAETVLFGSRSAGRIEEVSDSDLELCRRLLDSASRNGVHVVDHILVTDEMFRFMSESTDLWVPGTGLMN